MRTYSTSHQRLFTKTHVVLLGVFLFASVMNYLQQRFAGNEIARYWIWFNLITVAVLSSLWLLPLNIRTAVQVAAYSGLSLFFITVSPVGEPDGYVGLAVSIGLALRYGMLARHRWLVWVLLGGWLATFVVEVLDILQVPILDSEKVPDFNELNIWHRFKYLSLWGAVTLWFRFIVWEGIQAEIASARRLADRADSQEPGQSEEQYTIEDRLHRIDTMALADLPQERAGEYHRNTNAIRRTIDRLVNKHFGQLLGEVDQILGHDSSDEREK